MKPTSTPLFVKTHDFILWLIQRTQRFPKNLRHSYTIRIENLAFDFEEAILLANQFRDAVRLDQLTIADSKLVCLRNLLRYAYDLQLLSENQIRFIVERLDELGRLLGSWIKGTNR